MFTNSKLTKSIRLAFAVGVASATFTASNIAVAQEATADDNKIEKISVTGSRIKRTDMESSTPLTVFSKEDIDKSGLTSIGEFLRFSTGGGAGGNTETATLSQVAGSSSIDQKGFGDNYTLVLLNGRRLPGNAIAQSFVDVNQVPLAAVERIEYLQEGAAAIYGSDAVAGVVNIITKKDMNGASFSTSYGANVKERDGENITAQLVAGTSNEKTSILFAFDYWQRKPVQAFNRELGSTGYQPLGTEFDGRSSFGTPGFVDVYYTPAGETDVANVTTPFADCPETHTGVSGQRGAVCAYDFAPLYQLVPQGDRQSIYTIVNHELNDDVALTGEFRFSRAYTLTSNGAAPGVVDVTASPFVADYLPTVFAPDVAAAILADENAEIFVGRRYLDFGNRKKDNTNTTFSGVLGAQGILADDYDWDFHIGHSKLVNTQVGAGGQLLRNDIEDAFADGLLNPFVINTFTTEEEIGVLNDLSSATHRTGEMDQSFAGINFSGETGLELPGGELGFAVGADWRREAYSDRADTASISGQVIGGAGSNGGGARNNTGVFLELAAPIIETVDLNVAVRNDDITWTGGDASKTTWQAGLAFTPSEMFLFRASAGTGFKAPALHELFLGQSFGVQSAVDTKRCAEEGNNVDTHPTCQNVEIRSRSGGNTELGPETSETYNLGVVVAPFEGLDFTVDYWSLKVENIIGSLGVQEILNNEATLPGLVNRINGQLSSIDSFVFSNLQNLTEESAKGISLSANYVLPTEMGDFGIHMQADTQLEHLRQTSKIQPLCDDIGTTSEPKWKSTLDLDWAKDDFKANMHIRYVGSTEDHPGGRISGTCDFARTTQDVDSYTQVDLQGTYFMDASSVTVGLRNIFDENPPLSTQAAGNWPWYDQGLYDNLGRYAYVSYKVNF